MVGGQLMPPFQPLAYRQTCVRTVCQTGQLVNPVLICVNVQCAGWDTCRKSSTASRVFKSHPLHHGSLQVISTASRVIKSRNSSRVITSRKSPTVSHRASLIFWVLRATACREGIKRPNHFAPSLSCWQHSSVTRVHVSKLVARQHAMYKQKE
eukprot:983772-Pelagomonas_calceolata.AAC.1